MVRVLLAGGGSGGSAAPVIAVAEAMARRWPGVRFLYIGTSGGPERALVQAAELPYVSVAAGRLRRYWTWRNLVDPPLAALGVAQAVGLVRRFRPHLAFGAGGFATLPPLLAARLHAVPVAIHQQDVLPGLANRILAPFASAVTVAWPETAALFARHRARTAGNPVRQAFSSPDPERARGRLGLDPGVPLVLAMGGGTGALRLNQLVAEAARSLAADCELVHLTGAGKAVAGWAHPRYHPLEFLTDGLPDLLAAADVVISRAGMSSLAEIAALGKAAIVVPMPDSHQEANAAAFTRYGGGLLRREQDLTADALVRDARRLLADADRRRTMGEAARARLGPDAAQRICALLEGLAFRPGRALGPETAPPPPSPRVG